MRLKCLSVSHLFAGASIATTHLYAELILSGRNALRVSQASIRPAAHRTAVTNDVKPLQVTVNALLRKVLTMSSLSLSQSRGILLCCLLTAEAAFLPSVSHGESLESARLIYKSFQML